MTQTLTFAHISDIHLSKDGNQTFTLSDQSAGLLAEAVSYLNSLPDLDFVFVSGDISNNAHQSELDRFQALLAALTKPVWVIPGNHDGNLAEEPGYFTQRGFASIFNPQYQERPPSGQAGYFSTTIKAGFQLIGLDTSVPGQVGGAIDQAQLQWLAAELARQRDKLIIVGAHHPLYPLTERDHHGRWQAMFILANQAEVLAVLDTAPAVKLVLCGHHHMNKIFQRGQQLHLASPALASYPCAYRLFRLRQTADDWQISWHMQPAPPEIEALGARLLYESDFTLEYDPHDPQAFVNVARGGAFEWEFEGKLSNLLSEL